MNSFGNVLASTARVACHKKKRKKKEKRNLCDPLLALTHVGRTRWGESGVAIWGQHPANLSQSGLFLGFPWRDTLSPTHGVSLSKQPR